MSEEVVYPPEGANYSDWVENAEQASQVADQFATDLTAWEAGGFLGLVLVGTLAALRVVRNIPKWGPIVSFIGHKVVNWISPEKVVAANQRIEVMSDTAWGIVKIIEDLPPELPYVKELKEKIKDAAPEKFMTIFEEWKRQYHSSKES